MYTRLPRTLLLSIALIAILIAAAPGAAASVVADVALEPAAPDATTPQLVLNAPMDYWTLGGGLLYWSKNPAADFTTDWWKLKRRPIAGTAVLTMDAETDYGDEWTDLWADDTGLFSLNHDTNPPQVEFRATGNPTNAVKVATPADANSLIVAADAGYFYLAQPTGVWRGTRGTAGTQTIANVAGANSLAVRGDYLYMLNSTGLHRLNKAACTTLPCAATQTATVAGAKLLRLGGDQLYFWYKDKSGAWALARAGDAGFGTLYTALNTVLDVSPVVSNGTHLFWIEATASTVALKRLSLADFKIVDQIYVFTATADLTRLFADEQGVLFKDGSIYRIPFDAAALTWDLKLCDMQVVQVIQNWHDDPDARGGMVDLVKDKPTYVRVVGEAGPGPNAHDVEAVLHGINYYGGAALPGSPLRPVNNLPGLVAGRTCAENRDSQYWLFELPDSWDDSGRIALQPELDPRGAYAELNRDDNLLPARPPFIFRSQPPICAIFIPVRTHDPLPKLSDQWAAEAIGRWESLWPIPAVWTYTQSEPIEELEVCWWGLIPYPCWGPLELNEGASLGDWAPDSESVIMSLGARWAVTDDPDECDDLGARVHYVGMVNGAASTNENGLGNTAANLFWTKMPVVGSSPDYGNYNWPQRGVTMAHESGHNWGLAHVDCGDPEDVSDDFPYGATCWLNLDDPTDPATFWNAYWGFDARTRRFISPRWAADLMSYGSPRWVSDWTYEQLMPIIIPPAAAAADAGAQAAAAVPNLALAAASAKIDGLINEATGEGRLNWGWTYPTASLSQGILDKWQSLAAPEVDAVAASGAAPAVATYFIRLVDSTGKTYDYAVQPQPAMSDAPAATDYATFSTTFIPPLLPDPRTSITAVRLMRDKTVLDELRPGKNLPSVTIDPPAFDKFGRLIVGWRASDADGDSLRFNVQYSPDNGATWLALLADYPDNGQASHTFTLRDMAGLPGTNGRNLALIRVAASDGLHTALATSALFAVDNRAPRVVITQPSAGQVFGAGEHIAVQGQAMDAEDGPLADDRLAWTGMPGGGTFPGPTLAADGYRPGTYNLTLTATDSNGRTGSAPVQFVVANVTPPYPRTPKLDGSCNDPAYADSPELPLPLLGGAQGIVRLARASDYLYACFSGLDAGGSFPGEVGLFVDPDRSGGTGPTAGDYAFFLTQDGTPYTRRGDGGNFNVAGPAGFDGRVSGNETVWQAEMRIPKALLGNWDHLVGMAFAFRVWVDPSHVAELTWPWRATRNNPSTWATTALGRTPAIDEIQPVFAEVGGPNMGLAVFGRDMADAAQVLWDGEPLSTVTAGGTVATAQVPAARLTTARVVTIRVRNGATNDFVSGPLYFEVRNPAPVLASASPNQVAPGSGAFELTLTGSGFVQGSQVRWNGEGLPTTWVSPTQLRATVAARIAAQARLAGVTVNNPAPGGGTSAAVQVAVRETRAIYLPLIRR